ncbi:MAG: aminotransferase class V-fold PLP-dependent enzyme [Gemmatimonadetes bacterium]|nr:aminotransferase class V-fold PLP-dependent enzyme [Gemmatimonadota bacterium]
MPNHHPTLPRTPAADAAQPVAARRAAPLDLSAEEFRALGYRLVDRIADFLESLPSRVVTPGAGPAEVRLALGGGALPIEGMEPAPLLEQAADVLFQHSLLNAHPRFWGYINPTPAPIGALGEMLAASVNPNVGAWILSPVASEIERQTVRWIAELIGYSPEAGGLLVSGGNMANFVGFLAARRARADWDVRARGIAGGGGRRLVAYTSAETHTWIQKAADLFGLGTESLHWIPVDAGLRMDTAALRQAIERDVEAGLTPFLVVGTAGSVGTGAVDPLPELAAVCRQHGLWFHVDGAYGALAAGVPGAPPELRGIAEADSVAVDPHKWLYAPLDVGCALVRDAAALRDTFSYRPPYYRFDAGGEERINYYEYGPQNSRGFRALKVWLGLRQVGREGCMRMIGEDMALARELYAAAAAHAELQAVTHGLSIATFRYVPPDLRGAAAAAGALLAAGPGHAHASAAHAAGRDRPGPGPAAGETGVEEYLDRLNAELLDRLQRGGEAFLSNTVIGSRFLLRACIVNFRTALEDVRALPGIVARLGREVDAELRPVHLARPA